MAFVALCVAAAALIACENKNDKLTAQNNDCMRKYARTQTVPIVDIVQQCMESSNEYCSTQRFGNVRVYVYVREF